MQSGECVVTVPGTAELIDQDTGRFCDDLVGSTWILLTEYRQWRFGKIDNLNVAQLQKKGHPE